MPMAKPARSPMAVSTALLAFSMLSIASAQTASAMTCTFNGKTVPCTGWWLYAPELILVLGLAFTVAWLWALIDCIRHQREDKTMWVVIIIFLYILGVLLYVLIARPERNRKKK